MPSSDVERFYSYVLKGPEPDSCWLWLGAIEGLTALHWCDVPLCVHTSLEPSTHLLLGTRSENMADRAIKGRMPSATAARWRRLSKAERSARSPQLREELKTHGWDEDVVGDLVHGIDPDHPTLF